MPHKRSQLRIRLTRTRLRCARNLSSGGSQRCFSDASCLNVIFYLILTPSQRGLEHTRQRRVGGWGVSIFAALRLCNWDGPSNRTGCEQQTWRRHCPHLTKGLVWWQIPWSKPLLTSKRGLWRVSTGVTMLSSWPLAFGGWLLWDTGQGRARSVPKTHLNGIFRDDLISKQPSTVLQPGCASHVF